MRWSHNRKCNVFANNGEKAELTLMAILCSFFFLRLSYNLGGQDFFEKERLKFTWHLP